MTIVCFNRALEAVSDDGKDMFNPGAQSRHGLGQKQLC